MPDFVPRDSSTDVLPNGVKLRDFGDYDSLRADTFERTRSAYAARFPMENDEVRMELEDLDYDPKKMSYGVADAKKAIMEGGRLATPLYGTIKLTDKVTNKPIERKKILLANVPYLQGGRGTYVWGGNEYTSVGAQARLKSGIYSRRKENGELEAHCFHRDVKVWTEQGLLPIGKIVNDKIQTRVWSYDFEQKEFVLKPITGWFKNTASERLGRAKFEANGRLPSYFRTHPTTLWSTPSHKILSPDGSKSEVRSASRLLMAEEKLSPTQEQMIWGSLMGDGYIGEGGMFEEAHCERQEEYLSLKASILGPLCDDVRPFKPRTKGENPGRKNSTGGFHLNTKASSEFYRLRDLFYPEGTKVLPDKVLVQMDERALAFWFCDDGCSLRVSNQRGRTNTLRVSLATQGFSTSDIQKLMACLNERWGLKSVKKQQKRDEGRDTGWFIELYSESAELFLDMIAPYVQESMRYKMAPAPRMNDCLDCQKPIGLTFKRCNSCCSGLISDWRTSKQAINRFGGREQAQAIFDGTTEVPVDDNPMDRWESRMALLGTRVDEMIKDGKTIMSLQSVPFIYDTGMNCAKETVKTVFDIEVEGTHNYFANGVLVSNCNPKPGTGPSMRLYMEPDTGVYRASLGQSTIKLYPVLNALGVKDEELAAAWGPEILQANQMAYDKQAPGKFYTKLMGNKADPNLPDADKIAQVQAKLAAMALDPEVTTRTLGEPITSLSPQAITKATTKLLKIHRGEAEEDDRDSLANKYFMSTDDFAEERVRRDHGGMGRALLWKVTKTKSLDPFKPGYFTPQISTLLVGNSLSSPVPGFNPMEIRDQAMRVIQTGEGGVSQDMIPISARNVSASSAFFTDPIRSAESTAIGTDLRFSYGVKKGSDGQIYAPFRNRKTGTVEWLNPAQVSNKIMAFPKTQAWSIFASNNPAAAPAPVPVP